MGAVAKNSTPQFIPSAESTVLRAFFNDSVTPIRVVDFHEACQLSHFVPVVVLLPAHPKEGGRARSTITEHGPVGDNYEKAKFPQVFGNLMAQARTRHVEIDFAFGDVKVNFSSMEVIRKGESVILTALEFKTLKYFAQNPRRVISRDELLNEVWGYENYPCTRTVDNHILKLRQKLETNPSRPIHFRTVLRSGYKFTP
jgi:Transcriptional regulatory protein, C terminal